MSILLQEEGLNKSKDTYETEIIKTIGKNPASFLW